MFAFDTRVSSINVHLQKIITNLDDDYVVLPDEITLLLIRREICDDPTKGLVLHYRIHPLKHG